MKYKNTVIKILDDYIEYIEKEEVSILINILKKIEKLKDNEIPNDIIIYINEILNKIWNKYLTQINTFKNGDKFNFLVKDIELYFESSSSNKVVDVNHDTFKIITNKTIENKNIEDCGIIIIPDFKNNKKTEPVLPNDFNDKELIIDNFNYIVSGYYAIDTKLNELDSNISLINDLSKKSNLPNIKINKDYYLSNDYDIEKDITLIHIMFAVNYIAEKIHCNGVDFIKDRDIIVSKTKNKFSKIYKLLINKKINIYEFKKIVSELFESVNIDKKNDVCYIKEVKK